VRPFFADQVQASINLNSAQITEEQRAYLFIVSNLCRGKETIIAAHKAKPLNRYAILPGKTFAASAKSPEKYKILRLVSNDVVVQNEKTQKVVSIPIDTLLKDWSSKGFKEISFIDRIISTVKEVLGPVLGVFLTASLVAWLIDKLSE